MLSDYCHVIVDDAEPPVSPARRVGGTVSAGRADLTVEEEGETAAVRRHGASSGTTATRRHAAAPRMGWATTDLFVKTAASRRFA